MTTNERSEHPNRPPAPSGGVRQEAKGKKSLVLCHGYVTKLTETPPAPERGGRQDEKTKGRKQDRPTPKTDPKTQNTLKEVLRKNPLPKTQKNGKRSGAAANANISHLRLRLEIHLRYVGPPV